MVLMASACDRAAPAVASTDRPLAFAVLTDEGRATAEPQWRPLLDDLADATGASVEAGFMTDPADLLGAFRDGRIDLAWAPAIPAVSAIDDQDAELLARAVGADNEAERVLLIARGGSDLTLRRVLECDRTLRYGADDPVARPETLVATIRLLSPRGLDPQRCFLATRTGDPASLVRALTANEIDVAVIGAATLADLMREAPAVASQVEVLWRSEPLPEAVVLARQGLDPARQEQARAFFLAYGQDDGAPGDARRRVLAGLGQSGFRAADDAYLNPAREVAAEGRRLQAVRDGDATGAQAAQAALGRLLALREVQP